MKKWFLLCVGFFGMAAFVPVAQCGGHSACLLVSLPAGVQSRYEVSDGGKKALFSFKDLSLLELKEHCVDVGGDAIEPQFLLLGECAAFSLDLRSYSSPVITVMECGAPLQLFIELREGHSAPIPSLVALSDKVLLRA